MARLTAPRPSDLRAWQRLCPAERRGDESVQTAAYPEQLPFQAGAAGVRLALVRPLSRVCGCRQNSAQDLLA